jgi:hypothetical protein
MSFKGNKAALPSKICEACGRPMTWRKSWAKNWAEVRYCSDACRRLKATGRVEVPKTGLAKPAPNVKGSAV